MSGPCIPDSLGINAAVVKAHIPKSARNNAEMPKPPRISEASSRRGLSETDHVVANNVERLYVEHGIIGGNQSELARKAKIDPTFISKLLKRKNSVSVATLHKIAGALGLQAWMLLVPGDWPLSNPPVLQPLSDAERQLYAKLKEAVQLARGGAT